MADDTHALDSGFAQKGTDDERKARNEEAPARPDRTAGHIAKALKRQIGPERYRAWFESGTTTLRVVGDRLKVDSQNQFVADWIDRHFAGALRTVAQEALGDGAGVDVAVCPASSSTRPGEDARTNADHGLHGHSKRRALANKDHGSLHAAHQRVGRHDDSHVPNAPASLLTPPSPRSTLRSLDDFVVGDSNRLAFVAAQRVADHDDPADASALLIYGECGVGKTHILQGICRRYNERCGRTNAARYLTAEHFTNDYITAIRQHTLDAFRKEYRGIELLAIDDVHFLASKTSTQNEFLHTMDAIDFCGARLVLASDQHPRQIPQLHPSLVSRLVARLVVRIDPPDRTMRLEIVKAMAARRGLPLLDSAAEAIAARCQGSVREVQGVLAQLSAMRHLTSGGRHEAVGTLLTDQLFRHHDPVARSGPVRMTVIIDEACELLAIERADLFGRSRHARVVLGRGLITYVARELTSHSYPEIAQALGRSCHSTVHAAARRIEAIVRTPADGNDGIASRRASGPVGAAEVRRLLEELRIRVLRGSAGRHGE